MRRCPAAPSRFGGSSWRRHSRSTTAPFAPHSAFLTMCVWPSAHPPSYLRWRPLLMPALRLSICQPFNVSQDVIDIFAPGASASPTLGWLVDGLRLGMGEPAGLPACSAVSARCVCSHARPVVTRALPPPPPALLTIAASNAALMLYAAFGAPLPFGQHMLAQAVNVAFFIRFGSRPFCSSKVRLARRERHPMQACVVLAQCRVPAPQGCPLTSMPTAPLV